jgi:hypothetical protein
VWAVVECLSSKNEARHLPDAVDALPKRPHVRLVVLFESLLM